MAEIKVGQISRLRGFELRQAFFRFWLWGLLAGLVSMVFFVPVVDAQAPPVTSVPVQSVSDATRPAEILDEMAGVLKIMEATVLLVDATMEQQPTPEEIAALEAQLTLAESRAVRLIARASGARGAPPPASPSTAGPSEEDLQQVLGLAQEAAVLLGSIAADSSADPQIAAAVSTMSLQLGTLLAEVHAVAEIELASMPPASGNEPPGWPASPAALPPVASLPAAPDDLDVLTQLVGATEELALIVGALAGDSSSVPAGTDAVPQTSAVAAPPGQDLARLAWLSGATQQLGLIVSQLFQQSMPGASTSTVPTPAPAAPAPATPAPPAAPAPSAPMSGMMGMMGGMMSGMMGGMMGGGSSASAGVPVSALPADVSLRRGVATAVSTIQVQPLNLNVPGMATVDFYVILDSLVGPISVNAIEVARLRLPSGEEITPLQWVGPTAGQHIEGTLSFPLSTPTGAPALPPAGVLTLVIRSPAAGGVLGGEQQFGWDLGARP